MGFRRKQESKNSEPLFPAPLEGYAATVELPEGHHVTIGELPPGTVVEVATWNGTGKPDESTRRFLLSADGPGLRRRESRDEISYRETSQTPPTVSKNTPVSDPIFGGASSDIGGHHDFQRISNHPSKRYPIAKKLVTATASVLIITIFTGLFAAIGIRVAVPKIGRAHV